jgi:serine/threonine protein kinase
MVALKILHTAFAGTEGEANNILYQEARLLDHLKHANILALIDYGTYESYPYIVKEYAPGGSLRDRLRKLRGKAQQYEDAMAILHQVGEALQFAHEQRIVHCDLKPENVLFNAQNTALVADFDIARVLKTVKSSVACLGGTPSYMSPEQFHGKVCCASDQYSLACMAYEMLTGQRPFQSQDSHALRDAHLHDDPVPPTQVNPHLPQHIDQALLRALEKDANQRFASVGAFLLALDPIRAATTPEQWAAPVVNTGPRLILHQKGTPAAEIGDEIFYEATVAMGEDVVATEVAAKRVAHSPKKKAVATKASTTGTAKSKPSAASTSKAAAEKKAATSSTRKAGTVEKKVAASTTKKAGTTEKKAAASTTKKSGTTEKKAATSETKKSGTVEKKVAASATKKTGVTVKKVKDIEKKDRVAEKESREAARKPVSSAKKATEVTKKATSAAKKPGVAQKETGVATKKATTAVKKTPAKKVSATRSATSKAHSIQ